MSHSGIAMVLHNIAINYGPGPRWGTWRKKCPLEVTVIGNGKVYVSQSHVYYTVYIFNDAQIIIKVTQQE